MSLEDGQQIIVMILWVLCRRSLLVKSVVTGCMVANGSGDCSGCDFSVAVVPARVFLSWGFWASNWTYVLNFRLRA